MVFIILISFICLQQKTHVNLIKKVCENKDFCKIVMSSENTKILEFIQYQKSDKAPFVIYADLECLIEKTDRSKNNPENLSTARVSEHIPSGFSISTILSFKSIKNKEEKVL